MYRRLIANMAAIAALLALGAAPAEAQEPSGCPSAEAHEIASGGPPTTGRAVDDPLFPQQWGLEQIKVEGAWARGFSGRGVTVAVIDSGIDTHHPELPSERLLAGQDFVPDFDPTNCAAGPEDDQGHGTHVAGIIGAEADNGIGMAGVAPQVTLLSFKICNALAQCESKRKIADAIRAAADAGADVINMSFGFSTLTTAATGDDPDLGAAVEYAWQRGAVLVAGAGNSSQPTCFSPASIAPVVCVMSSDRRGLPTEYSNLSVDPDEVVAVRAPGGTLPGTLIVTETLGTCDEGVLSLNLGENPVFCDPAGYRPRTGTSMATPHVAGVAALLVEAGLTNEQVVERLAATATNGGLTDPVRGYGIVDATAATAGLSPRP